MGAAETPSAAETGPVSNRLKKSVQLTGERKTLMNLKRTLSKKQEAAGMIPP